MIRREFDGGGSVAVYSFIQIYIEVQYYVSIVICWIGIYSIYIEIQKSKEGLGFYERIEIMKKSSILCYRINKKEEINFLDLIFDVYYLIIKEKFLVFNAIPLMLCILRPIVVVSVLLTMIGVTIFIIDLFGKVVSNKNETIELLKIDFSPFDTIHSLLGKIILIHKNWAYFIIYPILKMMTSRNKMEKPVFDKFVINFLIGMPLWYITLITDIAVWLGKISKLEIWKRKAPIAGYPISKRLIKEKLYEIIKNHHIKYYKFTLKISVKNRKISTNPNKLKELLFKRPDIISRRCFTEIKCVEFGNQSHIFFIEEPGKMRGYSFTTSPSIIIKGEKYPTKALSKYYSKQKFFYSIITENKIYDGVSKGFGTKYNMSDYRCFSGLCLRMRVLHYTELVDEIYIQNNTEGDVIKLNKKIPKNLAYNLYDKYGKTNHFHEHVEYYANKNKKEYEELEIIRESIIEELDLTSNEELYEKINYKMIGDKNGEEYEKINKELHKELENSTFE